MVTTERKHSIPTGVVSLGKRTWLWKQWKETFLVYFNLKKICSKYIFITWWFKKACGRHGKSSGFKSQFCQRPSGTFKKEFHHLDLNFNVENNYKKTTRWSHSALNFANIPAERYRDLGHSVSYCQGQYLFLW